MGNDRPEYRHLWITGLRRSGTTAIWRMFRKLEGFTCYDEPFNPKLATDLPEQHRKGTWDEFIELWNSDHDAFTEKLTTISLVHEMTPQLTKRELDYLLYLARIPTIIDFTRLNFKVHEVLEKVPDTVVLYLFRSPAAFATSHLINSENRKFLRQRYYRTMFFSSVIGFNSWGLESNFLSPGFAELVENCGIIPRKPLRKLKSVEKLLLIWLTARRHSEKTIEEETNGRVFVTSYEDIIDGRSNGLAKAIAALGLEEDHLATTHLRDYSLGYRHRNPVWSNLSRNAGFSEDEIRTYLR